MLAALGGLSSAEVREPVALFELDAMDRVTL
jgi:hypothetical protein